ncbi:glycoside hydrolase family 71 protein [Periconia macrospinosa]|uniref:Glycoside hydrolase family 71 protein n=1 Tax=Periconia macrospinosa TaxID=97972 RepID=A0A2V1DBT4_9PLEO|nr:glycoside hydrolase family 71 protein [Periconia macrospinosa]
MIGEITDAHTKQDIQDAKALGIDAFALNINKLEKWATNTVDRLFKNADELGFGLFFSFDMAEGAGYFTAPDQFQSYLKPFLTRKSYFKYNDKAIVSTFGGEGVSAGQWTSFKQAMGNVVVIPGYYQKGAYSNIFDNNNGLDGVFNWNSWPTFTEGKAKVSTNDDKVFLDAANAKQKLFMMGMSSLQFKHMDGNGQNWYRRGADNLEHRMEQALTLQPHMIEIQTWNDGGESHYMGNLWPEPMTNAVAIKKYVDGYDHKGYWQVLPAFIKAYKAGDKDTSNMVPTNGKSVQGAFWHHTLTAGANCDADPIGKPKEIATQAEDAVSGIVLVAKGKTGLIAVVNNGGKELGKLALKEGYNKFKFDGMGAGKVQVEVWEGTTMVLGGYGPKEVKTSDSLCNYNFQVVGLGV